MELSLILSGLIIFFARAIDMSLATFRILMLMKGRGLAASLIGFIESGIYIVALAEVVRHINNPFSIIFYAGGFAMGTYIGSVIEERIAVGYVDAQVISLSCYEGLEQKLRDEGFGVTSLEGCGKDGVHHILHCLLKRKDLPKFMAMITSEDKNAFVTVSDTRKISGGFFTVRKAK
ncbi:MAG: DUF5698 domain-containing protein [Bacillota bacterium]|nr:DUF5698 domain-containing protein [Bacillota bacterium]